MKVIEEIKQPSMVIETIQNKVMRSEFDCSVCNETNTFDQQEQIANCWIGRSERLSVIEQNKLKNYYKIGLSGKSHDGGFPVFDKIQCSQCKASYSIYCGVKESSNSVYSLVLHGILLVE